MEDIQQIFFVNFS